MAESPSLLTTSLTRVEGCDAGERVDSMGGGDEHAAQTSNLDTSSAEGGVKSKNVLIKSEINSSMQNEGEDVDESIEVLETPPKPVPPVIEINSSGEREIEISTNQSLGKSKHIDLVKIGFQLDKKILYETLPPEKQLLTMDHFQYYNMCLVGETIFLKDIINSVFTDKDEIKYLLEKTLLSSVSLYIKNFECICNLTFKKNQIIRLQYFDVLHLYKILDDSRQHPTMADTMCLWPINIEPDQPVYINQSKNVHSPVKYRWYKDGWVSIWFSEKPVYQTDEKEKLIEICLTSHDIKLLMSDGLRKDVIEKYFEDAVQTIPIHYLVCIAITVYIYTNFPNQNNTGKFTSMRQMEKVLDHEVVVQFSQFVEKIFNLTNYLFDKNIFPKLCERINVNRCLNEKISYKKTLPFVIFFLRKEIWKMYIRGTMYADCPVENCWRPRCHGSIYHIPDLPSSVKKI